MKLLRELLSESTRESKALESLISSSVAKLENAQEQRKTDPKYDTCAALGNVSHSLSKCASTGNKIATESRILKSLRFRSMEIRHAQISEAYKRTFEWAYDKSPSSETNGMSF